MDDERDMLLNESKSAHGWADPADHWTSTEKYDQSANYMARATHKRNWLLSCALIAIAYLLGYATSLITLNGYNYLTKPEQGIEEPYTPAKQAKSWTIRRIDGFKKTKFMGYPTPEVDAAWNNLTAPIMIRVSHEEMLAVGEDPGSAIRLADDAGGYLAFASVYHELHCLKVMRWYLYKDKYYPKVEPGSKYDHDLRAHVDHCIETFRELSMCRGDTSIYSYEWSHNVNGAEQVPRSRAARQCVNWSPLHQWMQSRSVSWDPDLVGPESIE